MRRISGSLAAAMTMALAMGAIGTPVAAADDAMVVFVQGLPGKNVELCVNGAELKSNMQYGGKLKKKYGAGTYNVAFRQKAPGVCKGNKIVARKVTLTTGESITLVAGKKGTGPTVRFFNNNPFLAAADPSATFVLSHAAKLGALNGHIAQVITLTDHTTPTLFDIKQGKQDYIFVEEGNYSTWMTKKGQDQVLFGPIVKASSVNKVNHYVAIGTKQKNFKLLVFLTPYPS